MKSKSILRPETSTVHPSRTRLNKLIVLLTLLFLLPGLAMAKTKIKLSLFGENFGRANGTYFDKKGNLITCSDGMAIDNRGNIYITGNGVTVFNPDGEMIAKIPIEESWTSNVCFGGKGRHLLFITAGKSVYGLKMLVKGLK